MSADCARLQSEVDDLKDYLAKVVEERNELRQRINERAKADVVDAWLIEHAVEHSDGSPDA